MILPVLRYPHPTLTRKSLPVEDFNAALRTLANNMAETMYANEAIGLAAPQVGVLQRLIVVDIGQSTKQPKLYVLVNPVLEVDTKEAVVLIAEGCLSLPGMKGNPPRYKRVKVVAQDVYGIPVTVEAEGLLAVCLQHECDHLEGLLYIDRLSRLKRKLLLRDAGYR
mgnify:CR=1 FL=1